MNPVWLLVLLGVMWGLTVVSAFCFGAWFAFASIRESSEFVEEAS